ncbi:sulfotransferase domain-containing protein [Nocardioides sp. InS609-2]|uniref:sulfotransferase domain-containing protein n=1 Tax=Nocardioides sp. InS609-2 TaxID=2760705 RepID=UPI0020BDBB45|nr:sulfotransferase domain-containing protein [Nocardioides sp. InS609-2]
MNDASYGRLGYNFSIVGCQKSGTSTLSGTISQHRLVCRPPRKEAHFFNDEGYDWSAPDYEADYTAPKRSAVHSMVGDSTPVYIMWPGALERMRAYKPDMPLIAVFRDPIERLFSHWTMLRTRHPDWPDWSGFITEFRPTTLPSSIPDDVSAMRYKHLSGVARGFYGAQLERGFSIFPREQWLLLEFRTLLREYDDTVDSVTDFLDLPRFDQRPPLRNRYAGAELVSGTAPTADEISGLASLYAEDLVLFGKLSGIDTSAWPTSRILAGDLEPGVLAERFATKVAPPTPASSSVE